MRRNFFRLMAWRAPFRLHKGPSLRSSRERKRKPGRLRAGRIHDRPIRGNSNWAADLVSGQYRLVESLQKFHHYYAKTSKGMPDTCSCGSTSAGSRGNIRRLTHIFLRGRTGRRPVAGGLELFQAIRTGGISSSPRRFHGGQRRRHRRQHQTAGPSRRKTN